MWEHIIKEPKLIETNGKKDLTAFLVDQTEQRIGEKTKIFWEKLRQSVLLASFQDFHRLLKCFRPAWDCRCVFLDPLPRPLFWDVVSPLHSK